MQGGCKAADDERPRIRFPDSARPDVWHPATIRASYTIQRHHLRWHWTATEWRAEPPRRVDRTGSAWLKRTAWRKAKEGEGT